MNNRYQVEQLPNGLIRVFDRASQLRGCYHAADGTYAHGDLHAATLDALLKEEADESPSFVSQISVEPMYRVADGECLDQRPAVAAQRDCADATCA